MSRLFILCCAQASANVSIHLSHSFYSPFPMTLSPELYSEYVSTCTWPRRGETLFISMFVLRWEVYSHCNGSENVAQQEGTHWWDWILCLNHQTTGISLIFIFLFFLLIFHEGVGGWVSGFYVQFGGSMMAIDTPLASWCSSYCLI